MGKDNGVVNLRLTPAVLEQAAALVPHLTQMLGKPCTRSDVLRQALVQGLRALEIERRDATKGGGDG